jgi:predicted membrane protein
MTGQPPAGFRLTPQALFGLLVIAFGLLLTGDNLGYFEADQVLRYWPLGLVAVGLLKLLQSTGASGRMAGGLLLLFGLLLSAENVLGWNVEIEDWWPLALVGVGLLIVSRAFARGPALAGPASAGERVSEFAIWSGKVRRNASPAFQRADLSAIMGGVELDLRGATAAPGGAVIDVFVMWGGVEIWVPPDWAVNNEVVVLMGGAEDKTAGRQDARNRLTVRGLCIMGGIEIGPKT